MKHQVVERKRMLGSAPKSGAPWVWLVKRDAAFQPVCAISISRSLFKKPSEAPNHRNSETARGLMKEIEIEWREKEWENQKKWKRWGCVSHQAAIYFMPWESHAGTLFTITTTKSIIQKKENKKSLSINPPQMFKALILILQMLNNLTFNTHALIKWHSFPTGRT